GRNHHLVPAPPIAAQRQSDQPFIVTDLPIVQAVDVGGVDQSHPGVEGSMNDPHALLSGGPLLNRQVHPPIPASRPLRGVATELAAGNHWTPRIGRRNRRSSSRTSK